MFSVPNGKPGVLPAYLAVPREVFAANRTFAQFVAGPVTIDGSASGNPLNAPYTWVLFAGTLMGRISSTGKFANGVVGQTTAAYAHGGGSNTTVQTDVNTAVEVVRRLGGSGTIKLTGPAVAGGAVATQVVAYSAVNTATGAITVTPTGADAIAGSLLQPTDGSEALVTVLCDAWGVKVADQLGAARVDVLGGQLLAAGGTLNTAAVVNYPADQLGAARVDVLDGQLLAAGGTLNSAALVNYPADPGLRAWVKAAVRVACPGVNFSDDFA